MGHRLASLVLLLGALAAGACSAQERLAEEQAAIVGGSTAGTAYPAVGLLADLTGTTPVFLCTGTLVAPNAVLTAAHCLQVGLPESVGFALRNSMTGATLASFTLGSFISPNEGYVGDEGLPVGVGQANDIGLLTLVKPITSTPPILLVRPSEVPSATALKAKLVVVGAGRSVAELETSSGVMRKATISVTDVGDYELEVAMPSEAQPCFGDSGGPLLYDVDPGPGVSLRLVGVISRTADPFVEACDDGAVGTRVDAYIAWLSTLTTLPCGSGFDNKPCGDAGVGSDAGNAHDGPRGGTGGGTGSGPGGALVPKPSGCSVASTARTGLGHFAWVLLAIAVTGRRRRRPR